jgi:hypothetical protein
MRFKLDECVDVRLARLFEDAGYDAETVFSEKFQIPLFSIRFRQKGLLSYVTLRSF